MTPSHPHNRKSDSWFTLNHVLAVCLTITTLGGAYTWLVRPAIAENEQDARITSVEKCTERNTALAKDAVKVAADANEKTVRSLEQIKADVAQIKVEQAASRATQQQVLLALRDLRDDREADRKELIELIKRQ